MDTILIKLSLRGLTEHRISAHLVVFKLLETRDNFLNLSQNVYGFRELKTFVDFALKYVNFVGTLILPWNAQPAIEVFRVNVSGFCKLLVDSANIMQLHFADSLSILPFPPTF